VNASRPSAAWLVVAAGFLCMTIAAGVGWYVFPVYLTSIESDLGCTRTQMSLAVGVWALAGGCFSPVVGSWIDRYGARTVMTLGTLCQFVTTLLLTRVEAPWHLYLLFILAALSNAGNTTLPVSAMITRWFDKNRGTAMAIAFLGMGCGGLTVPVLANVFLERFGWRTGYLIFAFFVLALLVPIQLWIRDKPSGAGVRQSAAGEDPTGGIRPEAPSESLDPASLTISESVRTRTFWMLGTGDFFISIVVLSVGVHMVAFTTHSGVSQSSAATAYGTSLAVNSIGLLLFGAAADRLQIRWLMVVCYGVPAIAMLFLFRLPSLALLYAFALLFGTCAGGRAALWPLVVGKSFGVANLGSILGWLAIPFMIGGAIGPYIAGYIYDATQGYRPLFILCVGLSLCSAVFVSRIRNECPHSG
jgi:MFS family permease